MNDSCYAYKTLLAADILRFVAPPSKIVRFARLLPSHHIFSCHNNQGAPLPSRGRDSQMDSATLMRASFDAAVAAADPLRIVAPHLPARPDGRVVVVGAGKAGASMALAVESAWPDVGLEGLVITRYGHGAATERIRVVEAGHPVPDVAGESAAHEILQYVSRLQPDDLLLVLVSGGGSSLLSLPVPDVPMTALKSVTSMLLASGAPIEQMNVVRKHLSRISGGRLGAAAAERGAQVVALIISAVTGDAPTDIASGPCAPDPTTSRCDLVLSALALIGPPRSPPCCDLCEREVPETRSSNSAVCARRNRVIVPCSSILQRRPKFFLSRTDAIVLGRQTVNHGESRGRVAKCMRPVVRLDPQRTHPFKVPVAELGAVHLLRCRQGCLPGAGRCSGVLLSLAGNLALMSWGVHALRHPTDRGMNDAGRALARSKSLQRRHAVSVPDIA